MPITEDFYAFVDTETGGLVPGKSPIIEVATILTDLALKEVARFEAKIRLRAGDVVDPGAARVNGYTPEAWTEAIPFAEYMGFLEKQIPRGSVAIPVGHNVGFDRDMIDKGYYTPAKRFCPLGYRKVDTLTIAMCLRAAGLIRVPDLKLGSVGTALGIPLGRAHSAMSDALVAKGIFEHGLALLKREKAPAVAS